jgi:hypothetical protein
MWTYRQSTGDLLLNGKLVATGYSGRESGKNNPKMQDVSNTGPLPRGRYVIGAAYNSTKRGPQCITLIPDAANQMFGRGDFRIHGDSIKTPGSASHGCIIMPRNVRDRIVASSDKILEVIE